MKGAQQIISSLLITGLIIVIISAVIAVGFPLFEKSRDTIKLNNAEQFMYQLEDVITGENGVANSRGATRRIPITIAGEVEFNPDEKTITLTTDAKGIIYTEGIQISLIGSNSCSQTSGIWGKNSPSTLCVIATCKETGSDGCTEYDIKYTLKFIELDADQYTVMVELEGERSIGTVDNTLIFTKNPDASSEGTQRKFCNQFRHSLEFKVGK